MHNYYTCTCTVYTCIACFFRCSINSLFINSMDQNFVVTQCSPLLIIHWCHHPLFLFSSFLASNKNVNLTKKPAIQMIVVDVNTLVSCHIICIINCTCVGSTILSLVVHRSRVFTNRPNHQWDSKWLWPHQREDRLVAETHTSSLYLHVHVGVATCTL